jgi:hypothetical protein
MHPARYARHTTTAPHATVGNRRACGVSPQKGSRENPMSAAQRNPTPTPTKTPDEPSVLTRTVAGRPPQVAALPRCARIGG